MNLPADSQVTLLDPSIADTASRYIVLCLEFDSMKNTRLRLRGDPRPIYFVSTVNNTKTTVHGGDSLLATIERNTLLPDKITFPGASPINLSDWLKAPMLSSFPLSFENGGRRFEWRINLVGQLSLHNHSDGATVAWFSRSIKRVENGQTTTYAASIAIEPEYDNVRDTIVVSCLLAEHKLRMKEKNSRFWKTVIVTNGANIGI